MDFKEFAPLEQMYFVRNKAVNGIFWMVTIFCLLIFLALPFISLKVSVRTKGIIRPTVEKTEVKISSNGIVEKVFFKEGEFVTKGQPLIKLSSLQVQQRNRIASIDLKRSRVCIIDLKLLTNQTIVNNNSINLLNTALYKEQALKFIAEQKSHEATLQKLKLEWGLDSVLFIDKVISKKELFDKKIELEKQYALFNAFKSEQIGLWKKDLQNYLLQVEAAESKQSAFDEEMVYKTILAPASGHIQNAGIQLNGIIVIPGTLVCVISPETEIIAECFIDPKDIGMLKIGQPTIFQIDAFNYNYFGTVNGKLISIDNDFTLMDNKPVFKIRCSIDKQTLKLKNGFIGQLKKGLTLQARLVIAERTLWQLLFDSVNNWLDPTIS